MLKSLAVISALALGSAAVAYATPITGSVSIDGNDGFTSSSITFGSAQVGGTPLGSFNVLTGGNAVTMFPGFSPPLPYLQGQQTVPSGISPVEVFTTTEAGETFSFFMTAYNATYFTSGQSSCLVAECLNVTGQGYFTGTGAINYTQTPGTFTFTTQETADEMASSSLTPTTFSASGFPTATPEPASLALLGTGLFGILGIARRRFSQA